MSEPPEPCPHGYIQWRTDCEVCNGSALRWAQKYMAPRVPVAEWTDDEWLRLLKEFLPGTQVTVAMEAVARWRAEEKRNDEG